MNHTPDSHTMEAYRKQMMEMYRQATPSPPAATEEDNWLDDRYPMPDIEQDKEAVSLPQPISEPEPASAPQPEPQPAPTPSESADFVGYLREIGRAHV